MEKLFGFHYIVHDRESLKNYVKAVVECMAPKGVNTCVIEINNTFTFEKHPEISGGDITKEDLKEASDALRAAGVEPVPLYNCMGHQGWNHRNSLLKAHPELEEAPWIPDENLIAHPHVHDGEKWISTYTPAWCGNEPKVWDYVLDAIDELIDASGCKMFHIGMDEIFLFGQCDRCKGMKPADLFFNTVMKLYEHLTKRGIKVMIWGDRLLGAEKILGEAGKDRSYDYETVGTSECIGKFPKDILVCDWHYGVEEAYPSVSELLNYDLAVWPSVWYGTEAAKAFMEDSICRGEKAGKKDLIPGVLVTGWDLGANVMDCYTKPAEELNEKQQAIVKTVDLMAEYMKNY